MNSEALVYPFLNSVSQIIAFLVLRIIKVSSMTSVINLILFDNIWSSLKSFDNWYSFLFEYPSNLTG